MPYSKLQANVSELFWQSSWPGDRRTWIAPLLYAPPSFAVYQTNRDPALEAILDYQKAQLMNQWEGVDAQEYVDEPRREWNHRP